MHPADMMDIVADNWRRGRAASLRLSIFDQRLRAIENQAAEHEWEREDLALQVLGLVERTFHSKEEA